MCGLDVREEGLVTESDRVSRPKAYVLDAHVRERALFLVRARQRVAGEQPEWGYHLSFRWVPKVVPGGGPRGYWERTLCGPVFLGDEPELAWSM